MTKAMDDFDNERLTNRITMKCSKPRLVLVPYPAQGHVSPMLQLAYELHRRGFEAVLVNTEAVHSRLLQNSGRRENIDGVVLKSIPDGLGDDEPRDFFTIQFAMDNSLPLHLEQLIGSFDTKGGVVCVIADLLASYAIEVAKHCGIPAAGFWPAMMATYNLISAIPDMIEMGIVNEDGTPMQDGAIRFLPKQPTLSPSDLPWLVGSPVAQKSRFNFWLRTLQRSRTLPWLLVNSFPQEEHNMVKEEQQAALRSACQGGPLVLRVGPLTKHCKSNPSFWEEDHSCLEWLEKQSPGSVIYVSFGSWVGPIGKDKMVELALGLEATRRPFLLVLDTSWQALLPSGFSERVAGRSNIVAWAPQRLVLRHAAVGCFLTHCGWNSTVEAIEGGKRLLCYPVSGDQFVNCAFIVKVWGIGVQVAGSGRRAIEEGVSRVMEEGGDLLLKRVLELKALVMGEEATLTAAASLTAFLETLGRRRRNLFCH